MAASWLSNLADWTWRAWIAGGVLIAVGLILAAWAIRGDRAKGRRRCPNCWYDLRGTPGLRCSECGNTARTEKRLHKTCRRWRWVATACIVQVAGALLFLSPKVRQDGWYSLLPTWVLLWLAPDAWSEITVHPGTGEWVENPVGVELYRRGAGITLTPRQWRFVLEHNKVIRTRSRWPAFAPLAMDMRVPEWLGECEISIRPLFQGGQSAKAASPVGFCGNAIEYQLLEQAGQSVGTPQCAGPTTLFEFKIIRDAEVFHGDDYRAVALDHRWNQGIVELPIEVVGSIDQAIEPVTSRDITELVRNTLKIEIWGQGKKRPVGIHLDWQDWADAGLPEVALRVSVDLIRDGTPVERVRPEADRDRWTANLRPTAYQETMIVKSDDILGPDGVSHWTVRVKGDAQLALRDWDRSKYWAGEFTVPLSEVLNQD